MQFIQILLFDTNKITIKQFQPGQFNLKQHTNYLLSLNCKKTNLNNFTIAIESFLVPFINEEIVFKLKPLITLKLG